MKLVSDNINGLHDPVKSWKALSKLKRDKAQIVLIQETHLADNEHAKLNKMGLLLFPQFRQVKRSGDFDVRSFKL